MRQEEIFRRRDNAYLIRQTEAVSSLFVDRLFRDPLSHAHVVPRAGPEQVVARLLAEGRSVVHGDLTQADDLEGVSRDDDRRALVDADPEKLGILGENLKKVALAVSREKVLIYGGAA